MIKEKDIERAINLFKRWDLEHLWKKPDEVFIAHLKEKADDCLNVAKVLIELMKNKESVKNLLAEENFNPTLWIINPSYYSIFFNAQLLLAYDGKKLPEDAEDTHKTIFLAMLYYFIVKGTRLEGQKKISWEEIKESRLSKALAMFAEAQEESEELLQIKRAKETVENFGEELEKRRQFTYKMNFHAKESLALTSYQRAVNFRTIITEYLTAKRQRI